MLNTQPYSNDRHQLFCKRHQVDSHNGHVGKRYVWVEILAKKGEYFIRFCEVCPRQCLDVAKLLHDDGWQVTGIYSYYTPVRGYNLYQEASPWIVPNNVRGLTNGNRSLQSRCDCK